MTVPPPIWLPSGNWGGVGYPWPVYPIEDEPLLLPGVPVAVARGVEVTTQLAAVEPRLDLSGLADATLVVEFPAATEVWVGGRKRDGAPSPVWTLSSPPLRPGESHTFEVRARWRLGGKTFEISRAVTVNAGDRNRTIVLSGTEVRP